VEVFLGGEGGISLPKKIFGIFGQIEIQTKNQFILVNLQ